MHSALVLVVEGLGTGLVGAYGSSIAQTPAIDRLAAQGTVLDQCFVDSQDFQFQLRSLWSGYHAMQTAEPSESLWRMPAQAGTHTARLLTDSEVTAESAARLGCEAVTLVQPKHRETPAADSSECGLMELFATAAEELANGQPGLVWVHSRGLQLPWDAPLALRSQFADPDDPDPPASVHCPQIDVGPNTDPDLLVGWGQVAAAQASVIDEAVAALAATLASRSDAAQWSWMLASLGGTPMGEHGRLGWGRHQLYGEELHAMAIVVPAARTSIGMRRPELFQLPDLAVTVRCLLRGEPESLAQSGSGKFWGQNVCGLDAAEHPRRWPPSLSLAMISTERQQWIRTPAWSALLDTFPAADDRPQLFVKPDDRWEVSDIADRRRDILDRHRELATLFRQAIQSDDRSLLPALEDDLCNFMR